MSTFHTQQRPWGYRWRSSTAFIIITVSIALFAESFLYGFVVPILPYMLENRDNVPPSEIQRWTYLVLTLYGGVAIASAIFIGLLADLAKSRKTPLILALGVSFVGTLTVAAATNLPGLFIGRVLQAIGGTAGWIVGLATLRDSIDGRDMGKAFGLVHSAVNLGGLSGPAVAGLLLELTSYWITWGTVLLVLLLDIVMRLVMLEKRKVSGYTKAENNDSRSKNVPNGTGEESTLISDNPAQSYDSVAKTPSEESAGVSALSFYKIILTQRRAAVGMLCAVAYSGMMASYNTTIPTHVQFAFGWGSLPTGLLFALLQGPTIIISPLCGWLRDKYGTKAPATAGFLLLAPLIWLLGAADQKQFPWATSEDSAKNTYIGAIAGIGCVTNLMSSVATIEITCAVDDVESKQPGIFGPHGGYSRSYSLSNMSFATGLLVGPLISGALTDSVGYYYMNLVLACINVVMAVMAVSFLGGRSSVRSDKNRDEEHVQ